MGAALGLLIKLGVGFYLFTIAVSFFTGFARGRDFKETKPKKKKG